MNRLYTIKDLSTGVKETLQLELEEAIFYAELANSMFGEGAFDVVPVSFNGVNELMGSVKNHSLKANTLAYEPIMPARELVREYNKPKLELVIDRK
jgi:hypothetical protein